MYSQRLVDGNGVGSQGKDFAHENTLNNSPSPRRKNMKSTRKSVVNLDNLSRDSEDDLRGVNVGVKAITSTTRLYNAGKSVLMTFMNRQHSEDDISTSNTRKRRGSIFEKQVHNISYNETVRYILTVFTYTVSTPPYVL